MGFVKSVTGLRLKCDIREGSWSMLSGRTDYLAT